MVDLAAPVMGYNVPGKLSRMSEMLRGPLGRARRKLTKIHQGTRLASDSAALVLEVREAMALEEWALALEVREAMDWEDLAEALVEKAQDQTSRSPQAASPRSQTIDLPLGTWAHQPGCQ